MILFGVKFSLPDSRSMLFIGIGVLFAIILIIVKSEMHTGYGQVDFIRLLFAGLGAAICTVCGDFKGNSTKKVLFIVIFSLVFGTVGEVIGGWLLT